MISEYFTGVFFDVKIISDIAMRLGAGYPMGPFQDYYELDNFVTIIFM